MTFYLFLPRGYNPQTAYPLVLLLQVAASVPTRMRRRSRIVSRSQRSVYGDLGARRHDADSADVQGNWPCFVVVPQVEMPTPLRRSTPGQGSYTLAPQPNDALRITKEIVDTLQLMYTDIDANRRYITGLSMGGYGTWEAIERWPDYFAAAAPIAGAGDPAKAAELVNLPIWDFHGGRRQHRAGFRLA